MIALLLLTASSCHTTQAVMGLTAEQLDGLLQVGVGLEKDVVAVLGLLFF